MTNSITSTSVQTTPIKHSFSVISKDKTSQIYQGAQEKLATYTQPSPAICSQVTPINYFRLDLPISKEESSTVFETDSIPGTAVFSVSSSSPSLKRPGGTVVIPTAKRPLPSSPKTILPKPMDVPRERLQDEHYLKNALLQVAQHLHECSYSISRANFVKKLVEKFDEPINLEILMNFNLVLRGEALDFDLLLLRGIYCLKNRRISNAQRDFNRILLHRIGSDKAPTEKQTELAENLLNHSAFFFC